MRTLKIILLVTMLFTMGACAPAGAIEAGKKAPDFTLKDLNGKETKLSDFKGKVIILNFFATWCPPCRHEVPDFIELKKAYGPGGLEIVGVALVSLEDADKFAKEAGINYPTLIDDGKVSDLYGPIRSIPTTFILDKELVVKKMYIGSRSKDVFENDIKEILK